MSAGNKEKAANGGLENLDETEDPGGDRKEEKPQLEVEDEKPDKGKTEESGDDNLDTKKSSRESNETEINVKEENSGSKVEDDKSKNVVDVESQEIRLIQEVKKEEKESFRFTASVSSVWIPSVVGDQKKKFFLKAGEDKNFAGTFIV